MIKNYSEYTFLHVSLITLTMRFIRHFSYLVIPNVFVYVSWAVQMAVVLLAPPVLFLFGIPLYKRSFMSLSHLLVCVSFENKGFPSLVFEVVDRFICIHIHSLQKWSSFSWPFTYLVNLVFIPVYLLRSKMGERFSLWKYEICNSPWRV